MQATKALKQILNDSDERLIAIVGGDGYDDEEDEQDEEDSRYCVLGGLSVCERKREWGGGGGEGFERWWERGGRRGRRSKL